MPAHRKHPKPLRQPNTIYRAILPRPPVSTSTSTEVWVEHQQDEHTHGDKLTGQANIEAEIEVQGLDSLDMPAFPVGNVGNDIAEDQVEQDPRQEEAQPPQPPDQQSLLPGGFLGIIPREPITGVDKVYAVNVATSTRVEPLVAIFNWQADYSCMSATVAEGLGPGVRIRQTTLPQRNRWFHTPAGYLVNPQRYVELDVTAFHPRIPSVNVTILLLEHASPINGVDVYLGNGMRTKLERMGVQLSITESGSIEGQSIGGESTWVSGSGNVECDRGIASSSNALPSTELFSTLSPFPFQADANQRPYEYSGSSQANTDENTLFSELYAPESSAVSSYLGSEPLFKMAEGTGDLMEDSIVCGFTTCESGYDHTIEWNQNQASGENQHLLNSFLNWE